MTLPSLADPVQKVRTARHGIVQAGAECSACAWARPSASGDEWLAVRAAARRHVASAGHPVYVTTATVYVYAPPAPVERRRAHL